MILLNDFRRQWIATRTEVLDAVCAVGDSGWYLLGEQIRNFENSLAQSWGMDYAVGVASGLDALEIGLRVLGCGPGDRVVTTPLSAFATTLAIVKLGAVPVFVDTDEFGLVDLGQCERALASTGAKFLVPVHLYGHSLDLHRLRKLSDSSGCVIVEDCAQSILARFDGIPAGSVGALAATSFYPTKNLGAMGDSGAILSSSREYIDRAKMLRDYGQSAKYRHDFIGYNSRMEELHAAILQRAFLPKLTGWTERRRQIAARYLQGIDHPSIRMLPVPPGSESVWHLFPVLVAGGSKRAFMSYLASRGITSGEHYPVLIPDQVALRQLECVVFEPCRRAAAIAACEVSLPIHPYLTDDEVDQVIAACNNWEA
jgi:dTDP-3-amino-3,4,6-trideoxy-alpha-D-glucose transaminase